MGQEGKGKGKGTNGGEVDEGGEGGGDVREGTLQGQSQQGGQVDQQEPPVHVLFFPCFFDSLALGRRLLLP